MLETIIGLALLPFAIAVGIGIIAIVFIILVKGYKYIIMVLLGLSALVAFLIHAEWYWIFGLGMAAIFAMLWAIGELSSDAYNKPVDATEPVEHLQD